MELEYIFVSFVVYGCGGPVPDPLSSKVSVSLLVSFLLSPSFLSLKTTAGIPEKQKEIERAGE